MTESMLSAGIRCVLDNCPGATEDGARYAIVSFLNTLKEPDEGMLEAGIDRWDTHPPAATETYPNERATWRAMISHILKESESK